MVFYAFRVKDKKTRPSIEKRIMNEGLNDTAKSDGLITVN